MCEWRTRNYRSVKYANDTNDLLFMIMYDVTNSLLLSVLPFCTNEIVPKMCLFSLKQYIFV